MIQQFANRLEDRALWHIDEGVDGLRRCKHTIRISDAQKAWAK